jgi:hypothetical protein
MKKGRGGILGFCVAGGMCQGTGLISGGARDGVPPRGRCCCQTCTPGFPTPVEATVGAFVHTFGQNSSGRGLGGGRGGEGVNDGGSERTDDGRERWCGAVLWIASHC